MTGALSVIGNLFAGTGGGCRSDPSSKFHGGFWMEYLPLAALSGCGFLYERQTTRPKAFDAAR